MKDESGFTLVETVAGLLVMALVLGVMVLFLVTLATGAPSARDRLLAAVQAAQLQESCTLLGRELEIPPWWTDECLEEVPGLIRVKDLGYLHTAREAERPDLLRAELAGDSLVLASPKRRMVFRFSSAPTIRLERDSDGRAVGISLSVPSGAGDYPVLLGFSHRKIR
jgi:hypothetical protein